MGKKGSIGLRKADMEGGNPCINNEWAGASPVGKEVGFHVCLAIIDIKAVSKPHSSI
jgi:hypothetical protein